MYDTWTISTSLSDNAYTNGTWLDSSFAYQTSTPTIGTYNAMGPNTGTITLASGACGGGTTTTTTGAGGTTTTTTAL